MTSQSFCYWLMGWFELNKTIDHRGGASKETLDLIERHLALVFKHEIDPSMGNKDVQATLNKIHNGPFEDDQNWHLDPKKFAHLDERPRC